MSKFIWMGLFIACCSCGGKQNKCNQLAYYKKMDSLLFVNVYDSSEYITFYDPSFPDKLLKGMCPLMGSNHVLMYLEAKGRFSEERHGILYLEDNDKYYCFSNENHSADVEIEEGHGKDSSLIRIARLLRTNLKDRVDSLDLAGRNIMDGPLLKIIHLNDSLPVESNFKTVIVYPDI